jgi:Subtilase family
MTSGRAVCVLVVAAASAVATPAPPQRKHADLHTAIALTQAHLYGITGVTAHANQSSPSADVLMIVSASHWVDVRSRIASHGMRTRFDDRRSGYIRATVSLRDVHLLFEWPEIDAVRVDGLAAYDTRMQSQDLASLGFSGSGDGATVPTAAAPEQPARPPLTRAIARASPVNSDQEMGVTDFLTANPTFDGRGVGIGVVESTWIPVDHPAFGPARTLDGTPRRKVLRYLDYPNARREGISAPWSKWFDCRTTVCAVHDRVVRLPGTGRYRIADLTLFGRDLGSGRQGSVRPAAIQDEASGRIYLDANGDLDFSNERPLVDFNRADWNPQSLASLAYPPASPLRAVVTVDSTGQVVRLHPFVVSHTTMTASVAAGSDDEDNLARGVAPNASLVFVDSGPRARLLSQALEGAITLARDEDVDVLYLALVIQTPLGTRESFDAVAFDRISGAYDKPILVSAGNYMVPLANSPSPSGRLVMAVGQYTSSRTIEGLFGVRRPEVPEYGSTVGPAFDGSSRPDFLAASKRVAAAPCEPRLSNTLQTQFAFPPCYLISSGTSAASPAAAGAVALLLSGAKQRRIKLTAREIHDALIASASLIPGLPPHMQGAGVINVPRAWELLQRRATVPALDVEGELRHGFVDVLGPVRPRGLLSLARSDRPETMTVTLRAQANAGLGPLSVQTDGSLTVATPATVSLDQSRTTRLPVTITPPSLGHIASSWLTFFNPTTGAWLGRMLATAARPAPLAAPNYDHVWSDVVEFGTHVDTLVNVPPGTNGLLVESDLRQGDAVPIVANVWSLPLLPRSYWSGGQFFATTYRSSPGQHAAVLLDPSAGDWGLLSLDTSMIHAHLWSRTTTLHHRGSLGLRLTAFRTECQLLEQSTPNHVRVAVKDLYAKPVDGGVLAAPAVVQTSQLTLRDEFERTPVTIDVKPTTAAVRIAARPRRGVDIMLQLFDCTSGHCLSVIQSSPGEALPALTIRQPHEGIWKVFAVPIRPLYESMSVEVTVTQVSTADFKPLDLAKAEVFEGEIQRRTGGDGIALFRTDARAAANKEGWGVVSMCLLPAQPAKFRSNRPGSSGHFFLQQKW